MRQDQDHGQIVPWVVSLFLLLWSKSSRGASAWCIQIAVQEWGGIMIAS